MWDEAELLAAEAEVDGLKGWGNVCDPPIDRSVGNQTRYDVAEASELAALFVVDPLQYMDVCEHPEHLVMVSEPVQSTCRALPNLLSGSSRPIVPLDVPLPPPPSPCPSLGGRVVSL